MATFSTGGGNDSIQGSEDNDTIDSGAGDDTIDGGEGNDNIDGGAGNDLFVVTDEFGSDTIDGGWFDYASNDTLDFSNLTSGVSVDFLAGDNGTATSLPGGDDSEEVEAGEGDTLSFSEIETFVLTDYADSVDAGPNFDAVLLSGGGGNDTLRGGFDDDTIIGGDGADFLAGDWGDDLLTGGAGADTFYLDDFDGTDTVTDFDITQDKIDLSGMFGGSGPGGSILAQDIAVTDDGSGNAKLVMPFGEALVLQGVSPSSLSTVSDLMAIGVPCFTAGTLIDTDRGPVACETLRVGDRVQTADDGYQPIIWTGIRSLSRNTLQKHPNLAPVLIPEGSVANNQKPIVVSPQHRMLIGGPSAKCGRTSGQRFVRARLFAELPGNQGKVLDDLPVVTYVHLMTERHQVIFADGVATETMWPGPEAMRSLTAEDRRRLISTLPDLRHACSRRGKPGVKAVRSIYGDLARPELRRRDFTRWFGSTQWGATNARGFPAAAFRARDTHRRPL